MFGGGYFGKDYFGGDYFPPTIGVIIITKPKPGTPSGPGGDVYTIRRQVVDRERWDKDREKILAQIVREDEEIIRIIIEAINSGVIR